MKDNMAYRIFAQVYDQLMDPILFLKWRSYVEKNISNTQASILELGCGNGQLGILLKEDGYAIEGMDLSAEMLALAEQKQTETSKQFPLYQGDMRDLSAFGMYEAVISFCDTLCYLPALADLEKVFHEVYQHLENGGLFLFDVFTTEYIEGLDGYSYHEELPGLFFIWDSYTGMDDFSIEHELVFFKEKQDGSYERLEELHKERTYPLTVYIEKLKEAGFKDIEVTADFDQEVDGNNTRWFFKAIK